MLRKDGQVWIETVLYTLIGLALIGLILAFVIPKVNQEKDRIVVSQSIEALTVLSDKINNVLEGGSGNIRNADFSLKRGDLIFNSSSDEIMIVIDDLVKPYSQEGVEIKSGNVKILTETQNKVSVRLDFTRINITYAEGEDKVFSEAAIPYKFSISNLGEQDGKTVINIRQIN